MRYGTNSRKGSSSVIIVMIVVVIALAGTAIYAALDNTVLTKDGYAMPGSTATYILYEADTPSENEKGELTVFGYSDRHYVMGSDDYTTVSYIIEELSTIFDDSEITDPITTSTGKVNVPGLGNTSSVTNTVDLDIGTICMTTVLNGMIYDLEAKMASGAIEFSMKMTDSDIKLGEYPTVAGSEVFSNSMNSVTVTVTSESISVNDLYLYKITKSDDVSSYNVAYYIGNENKVPAFAKTGSSSFTTNGVTIQFDNDGINSINWDGSSYT